MAILITNLFLPNGFLFTVALRNTFLFTNCKLFVSNLFTLITQFVIQELHTGDSNHRLTHLRNHRRSSPLLLLGVRCWSENGLGTTGRDFGWPEDVYCQVDGNDVRFRRENPKCWEKRSRQESVRGCVGDGRSCWWLLLVSANFLGCERHSNGHHSTANPAAGHIKLMVTLFVVILKNIWVPLSLSLPTTLDFEQWTKVLALLM